MVSKEGAIGIAVGYEYMVRWFLLPLVGDEREAELKRLYRELELDRKAEESVNTGEEMSSRAMQQRPESQMGSQAMQQRPEPQMGSQPMQQRPEPQMGSQAMQQRPGAQMGSQAMQQRPGQQMGSQPMQQRPGSQMGARPVQQRPGQQGVDMNGMQTAPQKCFCGNCGTENTATAKFCRNCGSPLGN